MTITTPKLTFEEYLKYDDGTDKLCKFVDGELVLIAESTGFHEEIVDFFADEFKAEIKRLQIDLFVKQEMGYEGLLLHLKCAMV
ncbi:hypothetical protein A6S26_30500 [Nostoc sp. ATCC 43529]|nr:hypothetical protein A6S26_30500 [Nostoc sp. ATCC 43529]